MQARGNFPTPARIAQTIAAALAAIPTLVATLPLSAASPPPNFIIIFTDDQGYQDLGCFGSDTIRTPHIDRMAREGMRLTSFYAQAVCGPSRAALMTGCYPIRVAEPGNRKNQHTILHPQETTIAEVLQQKGYATGCIGKWHLGQRQGDGWNPATMPNGQGFDEFFGTPLYNGHTVHVDDTKFRSQLLRNETVVVDAIENWDSITGDYTREAIDFIRRHRDQPFFLYLAHNMPHIPLGASEAFRGRSEYGPYGDAIEEIDWSTGQILDALRQLDLASRTLVIFTSDNGPWIETTRGNDPDAKPLIPRNHSGTADPLKGYKMLTWEGGLRVPCVAWWPGTIPAGTTCEKVAATIDLLPTFASLAGAELPADRTLDGHDITPLLLGHPDALSPHDETGLFYYRYTALEAVRSGRWKLVLPRPEHPPWTGWSGRFHDSQVDELTLYDLQEDSGEARNVAADHPEIVARLQRLIEQARRELGDYNRIGSGARFLDDGPKRPDMWRKRTQQKPSPRPVRYDNAEPAGNLRFTFEEGTLGGWTIVEGEFGQPVTDRNALPNHRQQPFNKQGAFLLFTGHRAGQSQGDDRFTGVIESPQFVLRGDTIRFLVGGGAGKTTYVALCNEQGKELMKARGQNGPALKRVEWNVADYRGQRLRLRIVDRSTGGWGHVTFDDFSCEGELVRDDR
ncbi:sulfatase [Maioricimonas sp. JC845]|uniref:sulfatase family protein n=1 Tax=Maioricimonas sp. JC845 TaxID=3232138 RepID=UPI0034597A43